MKILILATLLIGASYQVQSEIPTASNGTLISLQIDDVAVLATKVDPYGSLASLR